MKPIKQFDKFIEEGIVKKQAVDKSRAEFLIKSAGRGYKNLIEMTEKIEINDISGSTFLNSCHDIIMELIRAKMLLKGFNASGFGAHEAEFLI